MICTYHIGKLERNEAIYFREPANCHHNGLATLVVHQASYKIHMRIFHMCYKTHMCCHGLFVLSMSNTVQQAYKFQL